MTHAEHQDAYEFILGFNKTLALNMPGPQSSELVRGGIVGSVEIVYCVTGSDSPWFMGPYGFVLRNPIILPFQPCKGALKFFNAPSGLQL
jgi:hypothetical protein